jgi:hypothetical protein
VADLYRGDTEGIGGFVSGTIRRNVKT